MKSSFRLLLAVYSLFLWNTMVSADLPGTTSSMTSTPGGVLPSATTKPAAPATSKTPGYKSTPVPKTVLPLMKTPFTMPGVVGYQKKHWEGTDYLGYLSSHISVTVEVLKGENTPEVSSIPVLEANVSELLKKADMTPQSLATEGPPLPFLHVLLIVYPADKDKYVIFGACRVFEQIQVMRKNFSPAGYWQGITWETQDVMLSSAAQLDTVAKTIVDKLVGVFIERYKLYNQDIKETPTTE